MGINQFRDKNICKNNMQDNCVLASFQKGVVIKEKFLNHLKHGIPGDSLLFMMPWRIRNEQTNL